MKFGVIGLRRQSLPICRGSSVKITGFLQRPRKMCLHDRVSGIEFFGGSVSIHRCREVLLLVSGYAQICQEIGIVTDEF